MIKTMWILNKVVNVGTRKTICFNKVAEDWLEIKRHTIKQSTYCNYKFIIEKYLNPNLANLNLRKIENYNYNKLIQEYSRKLSKKTTKDIVNVLKSVLLYVSVHYNLTINTRNIYAPRVEIENIKVLTRREKGKLERYCIQQGTFLCLGVVLALNAGLRIGEVCALKWEDIDLDGRNIFIRKTLQRIYNGNESKVIIDSPKTQSSIRAIPMTDKIYKLLQPIKKNHKKEEFFLTGDIKKFIEPRKYQYYFKKF